MSIRPTCVEHGRFVPGCKGCQEQSARYKRARYTAIGAGTWEPMVTGPELEAVREHARSLMAVPWLTSTLIADIIGVTHHTVGRLVRGRTQRLNPDTARALLGLTVEQCASFERTGGDLVDATGTARRLQALASDDWDSQSLADLSGHEAARISSWRAMRGRMVRRETHDAIRDLYEKIQSQADPRGPSPHAGRHAERLGYVPPERWADEDIDDPRAEPLPPLPDTDDHVETTRLIEDAVRQPFPGKAKDYPVAVRREIARHAHSRLGWPIDRIAELLGRTSSTVEYLLNGRKDRPRSRRS
jgi:plasmid maintenance system antidote protein VapI